MTRLASENRVAPYCRMCSTSPNLVGTSCLSPSSCGTDIYFTKRRCQTYDLCSVLTCKGTLHCNLYLMPIHAVIAESAKVAVAKCYDLDTFHFLFSHDSLPYTCRDPHDSY